MTRMFETADVSAGGMRLIGSVDAAVGDRVAVEFGNNKFDGHIARRSEHDFAIEIENSLRARVAMVRHVYSGGFHAGISEIRLALVARRLLSRLSH